MNDSSLPRPAWHSAYFGKEYLAVYSERLLDPAEAVEEAAFVRAALELKSGARVLDAPCGYGRHMAPLARAGLSVFGVDLQRAYLARARESFEEGRPEGRTTNAAYRAAAAEMARLPFRSGSFDAVVNLLNSFGYYPDEDAAAPGAPTNRTALAEFARVLKPGGKALFDIPERKALSAIIRERPRSRCAGLDWDILEEWRYDKKTKRMFNRTRFRIGEQWSDHGYDVRLYTLSEFRAELRRAGLKPLKTWPRLELKPAEEDAPERIVIAAAKG